LAADLQPRLEPADAVDEVDRLRRDCLLRAERLPVTGTHLDVDADAGRLLVGAGRQRRLPVVVGLPGVGADVVGVEQGRHASVLLSLLAGFAAALAAPGPRRGRSGVLQPREGRALEAALPQLEVAAAKRLEGDEDDGKDVLVRPLDEGR